MVIERIMEAQTASASGIVDVVQVAEGVVLRMHRQVRPEQHTIRQDCVIWILMARGSWLQSAGTPIQFQMEANPGSAPCAELTDATPGTAATQKEFHETCDESGPGPCTGCDCCTPYVCRVSAGALECYVVNVVECYEFPWTGSTLPVLADPCACCNAFQRQPSIWVSSVAMHAGDAVTGR